MGLDLTFQLKPVLEHQGGPDGVLTEIEVYDYRKYGEESQSVAMSISFPGMYPREAEYILEVERVFIELQTTTDNNGVVYGHVRANKWGSSYKPVTEFLTKIGVEWGEY